MARRHPVNRTSRILGALAAALLLAACGPTATGAQETASDPPAQVTTAPVALPTPDTTVRPPESAPGSTETVAPSTTTTTTRPPVPRLLAVDSRPVPATAVVRASDGSSHTLSTPFELTVPGGETTVTLSADGFNTLAEEVMLDGDRSLTVWLDPAGQLVHKLTVFSTSGAPKQVAFTPNGSELWVTLLDAFGVEIFDPLTGERLDAIDLPEAGAVEVIFNQSGTTAYVSQMETASVYEIDVASRRVERRLDAGGLWTKVMALSPDERTLYASNWVSNDVGEIDLDTGEVVRRIPTVLTPRGLYVTPDGSGLYVAGFENGEIQLIDLATGLGEVLYRSGGAMRHLVGDPARGLVYASDMARAHTLVVDTATGEVTELAPVDRVPNTIDLDPEGRVLYVSNRGRNNPVTYYEPGPEWGSVVLVDTATGRHLDAIVGGNQPTGLDVSPDGTLLASSDFLDDRVTVYRIPPYEVLAAGNGGRWEAHLAELAK